VLLVAADLFVAAVLLIGYSLAPVTSPVRWYVLAAVWVGYELVAHVIVWRRSRRRRH